MSKRLCESMTQKHETFERQELPSLLTGVSCHDNEIENVSFSACQASFVGDVAVHGIDLKQVSVVSLQRERHFTVCTLVKVY